MTQCAHLEHTTDISLAEDWMEIIPPVTGSTRLVRHYFTLKTKIWLFTEHLISTFAELSSVWEQREEQLRVRLALFASFHGASFHNVLIRIRGANTNVLLSPTQKSRCAGVPQCFCAEAGLRRTVSQATGGKINITYSRCFQPGREINTRQVARKASGCSLNAECRTKVSQRPNFPSQSKKTRFFFATVKWSQSLSTSRRFIFNK